nr:SRPBCC family protein [Rhodococcus oxybenzonivorans]
MVVDGVHDEFVDRETAPGGTGASGPLQDAVQKLVGTVADKALSSVSGKVANASGRLTDYAEGGGGSLLGAVTGSQKLAEGKTPGKSAVSAGWEGAKQMVKDKASDVKEAVTGGGGKGGGKGKKLKLTNIVETLDVGVPVQLAYNQWTQFADFPSFMKKVERVEQESDEKLEWKAQVFLSHRTWESSIIEQVPDERIVWRSKGAKGFVDGAVTFHEVTPDLTRIILVLEYHPKGFFEKTGNLWRAPGRRARLELKHFGRHVMTQSVLHPDEVQGWRGEIRDGEVVEPEDEQAPPQEDDEFDDTAEGGDESDESEDDEAGELDEAGEEEDDELEDAVEDEPEDVAEDDEGTSETEEQVPPPPRRRGRPRKTAAVDEEPAPPRRRGRPRKTAAADEEPAPPRRRGRPRKNGGHRLEGRQRAMTSVQPAGSGGGVSGGPSSSSLADVVDTILDRPGHRRLCAGLAGRDRTGHDRRACRRRQCRHLPAVRGGSEPARDRQW